MRRYLQDQQAQNRSEFFRLHGIQATTESLPSLNESDLVTTQTNSPLPRQQADLQTERHARFESNVPSFLKPQFSTVQSLEPEPTDRSKEFYTPDTFAEPQCTLPFTEHETEECHVEQQEQSNVPCSSNRFRTRHFEKSSLLYDSSEASHKIRELQWKQREERRNQTRPFAPGPPDPQKSTIIDSDKARWAYQEATLLDKRGPDYEPLRQGPLIRREQDIFLSEKADRIIHEMYDAPVKQRTPNVLPVARPELVPNIGNGYPVEFNPDILRHKPKFSIKGKFLSDPEYHERLRAKVDLDFDPPESGRNNTKEWTMELHETRWNTEPDVPTALDGGSQVVAPQFKVRQALEDHPLYWEANPGVPHLDYVDPDKYQQENRQWYQIQSMQQQPVPYFARMGMDSDVQVSVAKGGGHLPTTRHVPEQRDVRYSEITSGELGEQHLVDGRITSLERDSLSTRDSPLQYADNSHNLDLDARLSPKLVPKQRYEESQGANSTERTFVDVTNNLKGNVDGGLFKTVDPADRSALFDRPLEFCNPTPNSQLSVQVAANRSFPWKTMGSSGIQHNPATFDGGPDRVLFDTASYGIGTALRTDSIQDRPLSFVDNSSGSELQVNVEARNTIRDRNEESTGANKMERSFSDITQATRGNMVTQTNNKFVDPNIRFVPGQKQTVISEPLRGNDLSVSLSDKIGSWKTMGLVLQDKPQSFVPAITGLGTIDPNGQAPIELRNIKALADNQPRDWQPIDNRGVVSAGRSSIDSSMINKNYTLLRFFFSSTDGLAFSPEQGLSRGMAQEQVRSMTEAMHNVTISDLRAMAEQQVLDERSLEEHRLNYAPRVNAGQLDLDASIDQVKRAALSTLQRIHPTEPYKGADMDIQYPHRGAKFNRVTLGRPRSIVSSVKPDYEDVHNKPLAAKPRVSTMENKSRNTRQSAPPLPKPSFDVPGLPTGPYQTNVRVNLSRPCTPRHTPMSKEHNRAEIERIRASNPLLPDPF